MDLHKSTTAAPPPSMDEWNDEPMRRTTSRGTRLSHRTTHASTTRSVTAAPPQPAKPKTQWDSTTRCILGAALAIELLVFSAVSFAIAYAVSNSAIHQAGEHLAETLAGNVGGTVSAYMNMTESLLVDTLDTALIPGYQLPSDDQSPEEWWPKWMYALRARMAVASFDVNTVSVIFEDGGLAAVGKWWMNESWIYTMATRQPTPLPPVVCDNCTDLQWSVAVTEQRTVMEQRDISLYHRDTYEPWNPADGPGWTPYRIHDARSQGYFAVARILSKVRLSTPLACTWAPPDFRTFRLPGEFSSVATCALFNASQHLLGVVAVDRTHTAIQQFLEDTPTTTNTQIFIVDNALTLLASTLDKPFVNIFLENETVPRDKFHSCSNSTYVSLGRPHRVACRQSAALYPYPPLRAVTEDFLRTPATDRRYGALAGEAYFYVSVRIPSRFLPTYTMNLVLFLPEADIVGDASDRMITSVVICLALCLSGAIFANILTHVLVRVPPPARNVDGTPASQYSPHVHHSSVGHRYADHHSRSRDASEPSHASVSGGSVMMLPPTAMSIRALSYAYCDVVDGIRRLTYAAARATVSGIVLAALEPSCALTKEGTLAGTVLLVEFERRRGPERRDDDGVAIRFSSEDDNDDDDEHGRRRDDDDDRSLAGDYEMNSWVSANDVIAVTDGHHSRDFSADSQTSRFAQSCQRLVINYGGAIELGAPPSALAALFCGSDHAVRALGCAVAIKHACIASGVVTSRSALCSDTVYSARAADASDPSASYNVCISRASTLLYKSYKWRVAVAASSCTMSAANGAPNGDGDPAPTRIVSRAPLRVLDYVDVLYVHGVHDDGEDEANGHELASAQAAADIFARAVEASKAGQYRESITHLNAAKRYARGGVDPTIAAFEAYCTKKLQQYHSRQFLPPGARDSVHGQH